MGTLLSHILDALALEQDAAGAWHAPRATTTWPTVFGGEMLGQAIVAASRTQPTKRVKSVQCIFGRPVRTDVPYDIVASALNEGRNLGSVSVQYVQRDAVAASLLVLLESPEPDLVHLQTPAMPAVAPPDPSRAVENLVASPETIVVDDVDIDDPALVGPPRLQLWVRFVDAPRGDPSIDRALLAHASDAWLIGTAMRPHDGLGQSLAHVTLTTGVVSHALTFHGDLDATRWLLLDHETVFTGGGRTYGRGNVFTEDGTLVASFVQEAVMRAAQPTT